MLLLHLISSTVIKIKKKVQGYRGKPEKTHKKGVILLPGQNNAYLIICLKQAVI